MPIETKTKRITLDQLDPREFENYTTVVREAGDPDREVVLGVESLVEVNDGMQITALRRLSAIKGFPEILRVDTNTFLNGGELEGVSFPGVQETTAMKDAPRAEIMQPLPFPVRIDSRRIPKSVMPEI